jgi:hypothetical protein
VIVHLAQDVGQLVTQHAPPLVALKQQPERFFCDLRNVRILARAHSLFGKSLKVFGELDQFGGWRHLGRQS